MRQKGLETGPWSERNALQPVGNLMRDAKVPPVVHKPDSRREMATCEIHPNSKRLHVDLVREQVEGALQSKAKGEKNLCSLS